MDPVESSVMGVKSSTEPDPSTATASTEEKSNCPRHRWNSDHRARHQAQQFATTRFEVWLEAWVWVARHHVETQVVDAHFARCKGVCGRSWCPPCRALLVSVLLHFG